MIACSLGKSHVSPEEKKILFSILEYLTSKGIQLIIKEPRIRLLKDDKTIDEGAETIFTLYAQLAESEMRNKIARFARAKKEGFNKGKYMGGKITLGYKVSEDGYWEIDEEDPNWCVLYLICIFPGNIA